jgi:hypothetical protein
MSSGATPGLPAARASAPPAPRRWLILGTVGLAQLMVVLETHEPRTVAGDRCRSASGSRPRRSHMLAPTRGPRD